ncbi:hypothetical protein ILYODFUR_008743 [Ilyodon furcidens]|uniref:Uncharacterized protein n=1 Tax=Ilyodon furcidens TaxID=33524 RepID=A0ABV0TUV2_9TELE
MTLSAALCSPEKNWGYLRTSLSRSRDTDRQRVAPASTVSFTINHCKLWKTLPGVVTSICTTFNTVLQARHIKLGHISCLAVDDKNTQLINNTFWKIFVTVFDTSLRNSLIGTSLIFNDDSG